MAEKPQFPCELCSLAFGTKKQLETHQKKYCQGSALHKATIATREDTAGYLAPSDWNEEAVNNLTKGLKALDDTSQQLSIADLMRKLEHEAADKRAERKQQELSAQRAAERLARERAKAEMQQQLVEAQLQAQRQVELEAKVQFNAAKRVADLAEQQKMARRQQERMRELQQREEDLAKEREELVANQANVQGALNQLQTGSLLPSDAILRAQAAVKAATSNPRLSRDAEARVSDLVSEHAERQHEASIQKAKLLEQQRRLEETFRAEGEDDEWEERLHNRGGGGGGGDATPREEDASPGGEERGGMEDAAARRRNMASSYLNKSIIADEQRLAELDREIDLLAAGGADALYDPDGPMDLDVTHAAATAGSPSYSPQRTVRWSDRPATGQDDDEEADVGGYDESTNNPVHSQLEVLRQHYEQAGGTNPALLDRLNRLQDEAHRRLPPPPPPQLPQPQPQYTQQQQPSPQRQQPQPPQRAVPPITVPSALSYPSQPPPPPPLPVHHLPAPQPLPALGQVDPALAAQLTALQTALASREAEHAQMESALEHLRRQRASAPPQADALSAFAAEQEERRPSTREREEEAFAKESLKREREIAAIRHERELLEERSRLARVHEEAAARQEEVTAQRAHEKWMAEQKRQLVEARVQRQIARQGGSMQGGAMAAVAGPSSGLPGLPYDEEAGLCLFWDFVSGLTGSTAQLVLVYALYDGGRPTAPVKSLPAVDCDPDPSNGLMRAVLATRRQFTHLQPSENIQMLVELQQVNVPAQDSFVMSPRDNPSQIPKPTTTPIGWCVLPLFLPSGALNAGYWKVPVYKPPIAITSPDLASLPTVPHVYLHMRAVLTSEMQRAKEMRIEPDRLASLYADPSDGPIAANRYHSLAVF